MNNLENIFIAILVLQEETLMPAGWDDDDIWPWRKISVVPTFATYENGYNWIDNLEINGFNPEIFHKNFGEIHCDEISKEVQKIRKEIKKQYSGEIQILYK